MKPNHKSPTRIALATRAARIALAALATRAARIALAARIAHAARIALAACTARIARAARAARSALVVHTTRIARTACTACAARAVLAARAARATHAAFAALAGRLTLTFTLIFTFTLTLTLTPPPLMAELIVLDTGTTEIAGFIGTTSGTIHIGTTGSTTLNVVGSGSVLSATGIIGVATGDTGIVNITDSGHWHNTDNLFVGRDGTATLSIAGSGSVAIGGAYTQNAASTLALDLAGAPGSRDAFVTAGSFNLAGAGTLAVTAGSFGSVGFSGLAGSASTVAAGPVQVLLAIADPATGSITGDFAAKTITGGAPTHDFILLDAYKSADAKSYLLGARLAWFSGGDRSHGNFTLAAGESFDVDVNLSGTTSHGLPADPGYWDGASLTLTAANAGTLTLSAVNNLGDINVLAGTLVHTGITRSAVGTLLVDAPAGSAPATLTSTGPDASLSTVSAFFGGAGAGSLLLTGGTVSASGTMLFGRDAGASGTGVIRDGFLNIGRPAGGDFSIGFNGAGALLVTGGTVKSFNTYVGHNPGSSGSLLLTGSGYWSNTTVFTVGGGGDGTVEISGGATMHNYTNYIGYGAGASGTVTVTDSGLWESNGFLSIGFLGDGHLDISGNGVVRNLDGNIGYNTGTGAVTVSGSGYWQNTAALTIGIFGTGSLAITDSGSVANTYSFLGNGPGASSGAVNVSGSGLWRNTSYLYIGNNGAGRVSIADAGSVLGTDAYLGRGATASGSVSVSGSGLLQVSNIISIAGSGAGYLDIAGSGTVKSAYGYIAQTGAASTGAVTITGSGHWQNTSYLYIGNAGSGRLSIADAGALLSADSYLGYNAGSSGSAGITGSATWQNTGMLFAALSGTGILDIAGSGSVQNTHAYIGYNTGAAGAVTVTDSGHWENTGVLTIGAAGAGALTLSGHGIVTAGSGAVLGSTAGGAATVTVRDTAFLDITGNLVAGNDPAATARLAIAGGGSVATTGNYSQNAAATLALELDGALGSRDAFITADTAILDGALTLSAAGATAIGFTGGTASASTLADDAQILIATTRGITGDFATKTLTGGSSTRDFIVLDLYQTGSLAPGVHQNYVLGAGLAWFSGTGLSHGNFTLSSTETFDVDVSLLNVAAHGDNGAAGPAWDGRSLTLTGSNAGHLILSASNTYTGDTIVRGGTLSITGWTGANTAGLIDSDPGSTAIPPAASVSGTGVWGMTGNLIVGDTGAGALTVGDTGRVNVTGSLVLGRAAGATGAGAVSGGLVNLGTGGGNFTGDIAVGASGAGYLAITGGTIRGNGAGVIGDGAAATGSVGLDSGRWINSHLTVGASGTGYLTVSGGTISTTFSELGFADGAFGSGSVTGGLWDSDRGGLYVGNSGTGILAISGGIVRDVDGFIGAGANGHGAVTVSGSGLWDNTGSLTIGNFGAAFLIISGGTVTNHDGVIGQSGGALGSVTVSAGLWGSTGSLTVGGASNAIAALGVSAGGSVSVTGVYSQTTASSMLTLTLTDTLGYRDAFITAQSATLAHGTLDVSATGAGTIGFVTTGSASGLALLASQTLIHTTDGIAGDFADVTVTGGATTHDFLLFDAYKSADAKNYVLGAGLAWFSGTGLSHGNFTLSSTETFIMDKPLANVAAHGDNGAAGPAWDGQSLTLTAANTGTLVLATANTHTGSNTVLGGALLVTHTAALSGAGALFIDAGARVSATFAGLAPGGGWTLSNTLAGAGLLDIDLADTTGAGGTGALTLGAPAATAGFTGTLALRNNTFALTTAAAGLARATLVSAAGNRLAVTGTNTLAGFTLDGGYVEFGALIPADTISTDFLDITGTLHLAGTGTVAIHVPQTGDTPAAPQTPLLQQDQNGAATRLASSAATTFDGDLNNIALHDLATDTIITASHAAAINQNGARVATGTYGYGLATSDAATGDTGLYVSYHLLAVDILAGQTLVLDNDATAAADHANNTLTARLSGSGNLQISATGGGLSGAITLASRNTHTGTTTVTSGTLVSGADHALGDTARLELAAAAAGPGAIATAADLAGHAETIGAITTAAGSSLTFAGGSLTLTGTGAAGAAQNSTIAGALLNGDTPGAPAGSGALIVQGGALDITSTNADLRISASIAPGATIRVSDAAALGSGANAGLITTDGLFAFDSIAGATATGTSDNTFAGAGIVTATGGANITLAADNTRFTGAWQIAAASALTATGSDSLGAAAEVAFTDATGTLTLGTPSAPSAPSADWTLNPATALTGAGALVKAGANTITIAHANTTRAGDTLINGGTLKAARLAALGDAADATATITIDAGAALLYDTGSTAATDPAAPALTGALAATLAGAGSAIVGPGADMEFTGANTAFTGDWRISGTALMRAQHNLGLAGATTIDIAPAGQLTLDDMGAGAPGGTGSYTFDHALTGSGLLVFANTGTLDLGAATGADFAGTLALANNTTLHLGADAAHALNAPALARATLRLDTAGVLDLEAGSGGPAGKIGGLAFAGGTLRMDMDGLLPAELLHVGTLTVDAAAPGAIVFENYTAGSPTPPATVPPKSWLDQDNLGANATLLVAADTLGDTAPRQIVIHQGDGTLLPGSQIIEHADAFATYDYVAQTGTVAAQTGALSGTAGLYYDYILTLLDIKNGATLVLDTTGADDSTLAARVTGAGNLQITAPGGAITLSASNSHTGTTTVATGTLISAADHALGDTARLDLAAGAAADLAGHSETAGSLTTAAGSTLTFNGGSLTLTGTDAAGAAQTGAIAGALLNGDPATAPGALHVQGGDLSITSTNAGLRVDTTISAGATMHLDNTAALGSGPAAGSITIGGALHLDLADTAASGTLSNTLDGAGSLIKTGAAAVTLDAPSTGFTGDARVEEGRLTLENIAALGDATVDVSAGATLEYRDVTGTLANHITSAGTLALTGGDLHIPHDNTLAGTMLEGAVVYLDAPRALGGATAPVHADSRSQLWLGAPAVTLGDVTLDGARLGFTNPAAGGGSGGGLLFKTGTIGHLTGTGTLVFHADLAGVTGLVTPGHATDHLSVTDGSTGDFLVHIDNITGGLPGSSEVALPIITDTRGEATYQLDSGQLESGLVEYTFANGAEMPPGAMLPLDGRTWYLYSTGLSHLADAIIDTAALMNLDWHFSLDSLHLRMGEVRDGNLRYAPSDSPSTSPSTLNSAANGGGGGGGLGNVWVRARAYNLNATTPESGHAIEQYAYGVTGGADKSFITETGATLVGGFIDMGRVTRDFKRDSEGKTDNISVGVYGTLLRNSGMHADFVLKADRYKHTFDVDTAPGQSAHARYNSEAVGASLELGYRWGRPDGWWVEPGVQAALVWLGGADYRTTPENMAIAVHVDHRWSAQYRAMVRFGRRLPGTRWAPYGKAGAVKIDSTGGEIRAGDRAFTPGFDGWRAELGAGASYQVGEDSQFYFDYEYARSTAYERPWSLNLGYRHLW
jgi:outer membrane autotransporter protein